jgi:DNA-binding MarR family transcriptional regulator
MTDHLKRRLRQSRFEDEGHAAVLAVLVAAADVRSRLDRVCVEHRITTGQYNVLRILRGNPGGYPRCEITTRLIDRAPDVTRLIDRLERQGLVERARGTRDRRQSITRITRRGIDLLDHMAPAVTAAHRAITARLDARAARELARLADQLILDESEDP